MGDTPQPTLTKPQMTVTLTANFKDTLNPSTVYKIEELMEDAYALDDMLEFIDAHSEDDFCKYYEEYVRCGEAIGYEAVDALISEMGCVSYVEDCDDRYQGFYDDEAEFAEQFTSEVYGDVPSYVVVDWEATWDTNLRDDFTSCRYGST